MIGKRAPARLLLGLLLATSNVLPRACADEQPAVKPGDDFFVLEETVQAGHSQHGEAFDEGPRQKAYFMGGTGKVNFPVSTKNAEAQRFFNQGVGQLHGFWYFEAERSFRQAASLDPECAMNYWGMALANTKNEKRAKGFIAEAVKRKAGATEREVMYIDAMDAYLNADESKGKEKDREKDRSRKYAKALEQILYKYPDDIEAKAFLALQIWTNDDRGIPITSHLAYDSLLEQVLTVEPMHPCHHYRIHLWDKEKPERALNSAALCGPSAPSIAHMWHMPGHIYAGLNRHADAAWQQEASARVDHARMIRDRILPDQIHNFAHNNEWLLRDMSHVGRVRDAIELAENMIELPRHPAYNTLDKKGSTFYGRTRLLEILSDYELWDDLIGRTNTPYLDATSVEIEQIRQLRYLGRAHYRKGEMESGARQLADLEERLEKKKKLQLDEANAAEAKAKQEGKDDAGVEKAKKDANSAHADTIKSLETAVNELKGLAALAASDYKTALELLRKAPGVDEMHLAQIHFLAGDAAEAEKVARKFVDSTPNRVRPLAHLVHILWQCGKKPEAAASFAKLRELSGSMDLELPICARLAPIAQELGFPSDWRIVQPPAADIGFRPPLDSLGPARWQPSAAPEWALKDVTGKEHALKDYHGKPVVLIFFLGYGCLHCAEQINTFTPKAKDFADAGIALVAISTDDAKGLKIALDNYGEQFPFQLVSDAALDVFKSYRVYDDFEKRPLHATFVLDGEGLIRWQDIGFEPFTEPDFVLQEAQRQFAQSAAQKTLHPLRAQLTPTNADAGK